MEKLIFLIVMFLTGELSAHQGENHGKKEEQEKPVKQDVLDEIDQSYKENIASIFEKNVWTATENLKNSPGIMCFLRFPKFSGHFRLSGLIPNKGVNRVRKGKKSK